MTIKLTGASGRFLFLLNYTTVNYSGSFPVSRAGFLHFWEVEVKGLWLSSRKSVTNTKQQRITGQEVKNLSCHLRLFHSFYMAAQGPRPLWWLISGKLLNKARLDRWLLLGWIYGLVLPQEDFPRWIVEHYWPWCPTRGGGDLHRCLVTVEGAKIQKNNLHYIHGRQLVSRGQREAQASVWAAVFWCSLFFD